MKKVFNTIFENSIRLLLILSNIKKSISCDMIAIIDFLTLYSHTLGIGGSDINGQNSLAICEYISRQSIIKKSIKQMSVDGFININQTVNGFGYSISEKGKSFIQTLESRYKNNYIKNLNLTLKFIGSKKEKTLIMYINEQTNKEGINE